MSSGFAAMIELPRSARIYVDTNIWIYYLEANPVFWQKVVAILRQAQAMGATLVTSDLAIAECLVRPSRLNDTTAIELYERFFDQGEIEILPLDGALARRAALAGGALGLKLIDAIHYVSALEAGCRYILTGDGRFKSRGELAVIGID